MPPKMSGMNSSDVQRTTSDPAPKIAVADRRTLRDPDERPPGQELHESDGDAPRQTCRRARPRRRRDRATSESSTNCEPASTDGPTINVKEFDVGDTAGFTGEEGQPPEQRVTPDPGFGRSARSGARWSSRASSDSRRESDTRISAAHGMNAKPWTTPRCTSWPIIAPEYAKLIAAAKDDEGAHAVPAQQSEHAGRGDHVDGDAVDDPRGDRRHEGEDHRQRIERPGVESSEQRRPGVRQAG